MTGRSSHAGSAADLLAGLATTRRGLVDAEAAFRLRRYGPNRLAPPPPVPILRILGDQLKSVVVLLLVAAGVISFVMGDHAEAVAISAVLLINTLIGFTTELRARRAMEGLLGLDVSRASVIRSGLLSSIPAAELVPGDVIRVDPGHRVPADARILESVDLRVDEAALTGESLPVSKRPADHAAADTPLAERTNMIHKGTTVVAGTGEAVVTETGASTEIGRIGALDGSIEETPTPLERRLDELGRRLVWLALGVAGLVAALGALQGAAIGMVLKTGIALAVAAVPEALPAVATIALAVGLRRMARRNALVRRLPAVEALGSATVICSDKTRTLTSGRMTAVRIATVTREFEIPGSSGVPPDPEVTGALEVAALASRPQPEAAERGAWTGDPVDRALLSAARDAGVTRSALVSALPQAGLVPFSSDRKYMAAFHRVGESLVAFVKGAPGRTLAMCAAVRTPAGAAPIDDGVATELLRINEGMAGDGLRVLALATGPVGAAGEEALAGLTFVAFVGLLDPPAPGVAEAIARLGGAGLRTLMLTGDQRTTAVAIGRTLRMIDRDEATLDGRELDRLPDAALRAAMPGTVVFSRITPEHKLRIVEALQARGEVVAMLGDGVNDAPALRRAEIGVAMGGRGTDAAREAAAIVLGDDRFDTIVAAVEEGRVIFDNIRKFVFYLFSCNVAEVLVLLVAGVAGWIVPLLPLQILWLNMVTDTFPALALALEPGDAGVMTRPPRDPGQAFLSRRFLAGVLFYAALITAATLLAFITALDGPPERARTMAFMTLALAQLFHLGAARSTEPVLRPGRIVSNRFALAAIAVSLALQIAAIQVAPLAAILRVTPLGPADWLLVLACAAFPGVVGQAIRQRKRGHRRRSG